MKTVDVSVYCRLLRRQWQGARSLCVTIPLAVAMVLVFQDDRHAVAASVFYGGLLVLPTSFVVSAWISGRYVVRGAAAGLASWCPYLFLNLALLRHTVWPALKDGSFFDPRDLVLMSAYVVNLFFVFRAVGSAWLSLTRFAPPGSAVGRALSCDTLTPARRVSLPPLRRAPLGWFQLTCGIALLGLSSYGFLFERLLRILALDNKLPGDIYRGVMAAGFIVTSWTAVLLARQGWCRVRGDANAVLTTPGP